MFLKKTATLIAAFSVSCILTACGSSTKSDDTDPTDQYTAVDTYDDLGLCAKSNDGDSVYVKEENKYVYCADGFWAEFTVEDKQEGGSASSGKLNIYFPADDTLRTLSQLSSCTYSYDSTVVFIASLNTYMICLDYEWMEYKPKTPSSSSSSSAGSSKVDTISTISKITSYKCNSSSEGNLIYVEDDEMTLVCEDGSWTEHVTWGSSSSSYRYSSSSYKRSSSSSLTREDVLGECTPTNEGVVKMDSSDLIGYSSTYNYVCRSGLWIAASQLYLDTLGWTAGTDGTLKEGLWSAYSYKPFSENCLASNVSYSHKVYIYDGHWRAADTLSICFQKGCTSAKTGTVNTWNGYTYSCNGTNWVPKTLYSMGNKKYFNADVSYGSLTDERDGKVYKTVTIGTQTWMAENLNFADSIKVESLQGGYSRCYTVSADTTCDIGGRFYYWNAAMKVSSTYNSKRLTAPLLDTISHQGLCPSGWHVPDTTEWGVLRKSVNNDASLLKSAGVWPFYRDSVKVATNTTGFSAVPAGYEAGSDGGYYANFCTATQYSSYSDESYVITLSYGTNYMSFRRDDKIDTCNLRCIKNTVSAPASSSSVPASSDSASESSTSTPESDSSAPESDSSTPESSSSATEDVDE